MKKQMEEQVEEPTEQQVEEPMEQHVEELREQQTKQQIKLQMSESLSMGILLAITGGFLDAYTFICRGEVFANAQTGNIVLFGLNLAKKNWEMAFRYFIPVLAFIFGVFVAEIIKFYFKNNITIHWRQIIIVMEIILLFIVAFLPQQMNMLANITVSFVCALQTESFRKIKGNVCATTMCTGNLRTATESLFLYWKTGDKKLKKKSLWYYAIDLLFVFGAIFGTLLTYVFFEKSILFCCSILCVAFIVMFVQNNNEKIN